MSTKEINVDIPLMDAKEVTIFSNTYNRLKAGGYSGLVAPSIECGCEIDDLAPCGMCDPSDYMNGCLPGYKHIDPADSGHEVWVISTDKEPPSEAFWMSFRNEYY